MSTLVLLSQILQILKKILFSNIALVTQDIFLTVFENALRIHMILQSFIITMYLWFLNQSQKSFFFSLMQLRYKRKALSYCVPFSFHMGSSPSTVHCGLPLFSGITVWDLKAGLTPLIFMAVPWFSLGLSAKGTGVPKRKDHRVQWSIAARERTKWAGWTTAPWMDGSGKKEACWRQWCRLVSEVSNYFYLKEVSNYFDHHGWSHWCQQNCSWGGKKGL